MATKRAAVPTRKQPTQPKSKWDRSSSYRKDFLANNKGLLGGWLYFCVYCGKPITKKHMQVDHHIAVNYVKNNPLLKIYFGIGNMFSNLIGYITHGSKWKKNKGVNVSYNLVPACEKCNQAKSDRGGLWIVRGLIGGTIWKILNAVNNLVIALFTKPLGLATLAVGAVLFLCCTPQGAAVLSFLNI